MNAKNLIMWVIIVLLSVGLFNMFQDPNKINSENEKSGVGRRCENNNDCETKGGKKSFEIKIPTNKLFEKSGVGKIKKPPIKPITIEM